MKKILALIILGFIAVGGTSWLANYLSTGTISVAANNENDTITLEKTSGGKPFTKIAMGSFFANVKHGRYTATVKNGLKTTVQVINFDKGHANLHYSVPLASLLNAEPIAYENAQDIEATSQQLVYLDNSSGTLHKINNQNDLQELNPQRFQNVKWADSSWGLGQDSGGRLYIITSSSVSPLKVPFSYGNRVVNFDVSSDKKIYVSFGADVYAGDQAGSFKKIYTASSSKPALAAGIGIVAVSDSKYGANASNISKPLLATINTAGKKTKKNIEAERMVWSPNGQYLATANQASPVIYNTILRQTTVIPTTSVIGQFEWLNNEAFSYTSNSTLWTYNMANQRTQLVANISPTDPITELSPSSDGAYVYMSTLNSISLNRTVKRVGLKGQRAPPYIYKLRDALPEYFAGYSISMINFSSPPTILVRPYADAPPDNYTQKAQSQLQSQGFDVSQLRFQLGPPLPAD